MNRTITVTEDNIQQVMGLVKRFFSTHKPHNFETYHNFDCGWNAENPYGQSKREWKQRREWFYSAKYRQLNDIEYIGFRTPTKLEIARHSELVGGQQFIRVSYPKKPEYKTYPTVIHIGDVIAFNRGNYLVIRSKWNSTPDKQYIYHFVRRIAAN